MHTIRMRLGWWFIAVGFAVLPRLLRDQLASALAAGVASEDAAVAAWIDLQPDAQTVN